MKILLTMCLTGWLQIKYMMPDDKFIQKADPIFMAPGSKFGSAHFFAPYKQIGNLKIGTLIFNIIAIWIMIVGLFVTLYYNVLKTFYCIS